MNTSSLESVQFVCKQLVFWTLSLCYKWFWYAQTNYQTHGKRLLVIQIWVLFYVIRIVILIVEVLPIRFLTQPKTNKKKNLMLVSNWPPHFNVRRTISVHNFVSIVNVLNPNVLMVSTNLATTVRILFIAKTLQIPLNVNATQFQSINNKSST